MDIEKTLFGPSGPRRLNVANLLWILRTFSEEMLLIVKDYLVAGNLIVQVLQQFYRLQWSNLRVV